MNHDNEEQVYFPIIFRSGEKLLHCEKGMRNKIQTVKYKKFTQTLPGRKLNHKKIFKKKM